MEPKSSKTKKVALGAAGMSVFLHLGLFFLVGSAVIVTYAVPRSPMIGELAPTVATEEVPEPLDEIEPPSEPDPTEQPQNTPAAAVPANPVDMVSTPMDVITTTSLTPSFTVPVPSGTAAPGTASGTDSGSTAKGGKMAKMATAFGSLEKMGDVALVGTLYDLKQAKNGSPLFGGNEKYIQTLKEFCAKDWNRSVLNDFYKVRKPIYATQIYIPIMSAVEAPKAFKVEKDVQPSQWVILYEGTFAAPRSGAYRFVGGADDIIVVRVNGKVILNGSLQVGWAGATKSPDSVVDVPSQEIVANHKLNNANAAYSQWIEFQSGQPNKIEILIGEWPGGGFSSFLFIQQKGKKYKMKTGDVPILPIFRTADTPTDVVKDAPEFDPDGPVFGYDKPTEP